MADVADTTIVSGTGIVDERDAVHVLSQADRVAGRCYACATGLPRQIVPRPRPPASQARAGTSRLQRVRYLPSQYANHRRD